MDFIFFLLPVFIAMTICIFMTKRWGMGEKVDKGIAFCYWKLSYRRKFIRTLWMIPIEFVVLIWFHNTFQSNLWTGLAATAMAILLLIQAVYNYKKWKNERI